MTNVAPIVHVVDDDASWLKSVRRLISAAGYQVALYNSAESFLDTADLGAPGCVLLDLSMPGLTGLQLQQRLGEAGRKLAIVFVSGHGDIRSSVLAMKSGAEDFLTKPVDSDELLRAVARAMARDCEDRDRRDQLAAMRARVEALTPTERKVFDRVVRGKLNKHIAAEFGSAERTIKWHRQHIMQKLQVESLAELVSIAERLGLVGAGTPPAPDAG
jgi:FixJ family two-component response regulator